ncbi:MAG: LuxR C-terminal-related transcriptional regulator [Acetobacteraceae bacterium]
MDELTSEPSVLILDRHALFGHGLISLLRTAHPEWPCAVAADRADLHRLLAATPEAIVLIDLQYPGLGGIEGLAELHAAWPRQRIVGLSDDQDRDSILAGLAAGARAYVTRSANPTQFLRAIETVAAGGVFAPVSLLAGGAGPVAADPPAPAPAPAAPAHPALPTLTGRQRDVFLLLAEGCPTKIIARRLDLAVGTVKVHLAAIYRSLGARSRLEAVAKVHRAYAMG